MKQNVFALVDCNNFFVSCEKIFRPDLEGKPVVVLSSNDGCVIARSNEAKALGVPMGAPVFKYRQLFNRHGVVQFSSNFELYGDISRRITAILTTITPRTEIYSVDEAFLDLSQLKIDDYTAWGGLIRQKIMDWVGIPVSIGIGTSKTLAKLASDHAKKQPDLTGVLDLAQTVQGCSLYSLYRWLGSTPVQDVWGVGWRLAPKLRVEGINTARDLAELNPRRAAQLMGVNGRRLVAELSGNSCYGLAPEKKEQQSIARTRTFGQDTSDFGSIEAAVATFAAKAAYTLRQSNQLTRRVSVFLSTNKHKPGYKRVSREAKIDTPSADTGTIMSVAIKLLVNLYVPGVAYHRAGVLLYDFSRSDLMQMDLMGIVDISGNEESRARMRAFDYLNKRYGRQTVRYAAELLGTKWEPKHNSRSPRYTTLLEELPAVQIG